MPTKQQPSKDSEIIYRDLKAQDLEPLSDIIASAWHTYAPKHLQQACGTADLATYARRATFGKVAEIDGRVIGVALARAGQATSINSAAWDALYSKTLKNIEEINPEIANNLQSYLEKEAHIDAELLVESGENSQYELVLFAVSSEARGCGVGTKLFSQMEDYLKSKGATSMFLFTDSTCTWQYYESRGMRRSAQRTIEENGEKLEMYVYVTDFK